MEPVATHLEIAIHTVRKGIHIGLWLHTLVEGGIKYSYLLYVRKQLGDSIHALKVGRVVERCQHADLINCLKHFVIDQYALAESLTTMHHAVSYCADLLVALDEAILRIDQGIEDQLHRLLLGRHIVLDHYLLTIGGLEL